MVIYHDNSQTITKTKTSPMKINVFGWPLTINPIIHIKDRHPTKKKTTQCHCRVVDLAMNQSETLVSPIFRSGLVPSVADCFRTCLYRGQICNLALPSVSSVQHTPQWLMESLWLVDGIFVAYEIIPPASLPEINSPTFLKNRFYYLIDSDPCNGWL